MARWIRLAALWLSLLAIPFHGIAGATLVCHSEGDMAASASQGGGTHGMSNAEPDTNAMAAGDRASGMAQADCGGSLICHAAVALLPTRLDLVAGSLPFSPAADMPASVIRFLTGGPERPPRSTSA